MTRRPDSGMPPVYVAGFAIRRIYVTPSATPGNTGDIVEGKAWPSWFVRLEGHERSGGCAGDERGLGTGGGCVTRGTSAAWEK
jgi:hypothetical protein